MLAEILALTAYELRSIVMATAFLAIGIFMIAVYFKSKRTSEQTRAEMLVYGIIVVLACLFLFPWQIFTGGQ